MRATKTLTIEWGKEHEHPLFRAAMQMSVGVEQQHSHQALAGYAKRLRALAEEYVHPADFVLENGVCVGEAMTNITWPNR